MAKLTKNLAPLFDSSISYEPGERFMYGDHMYEALEPLSGAFDSTKVSEVTLADIFKGVSSNDVKCLAPEYDVNTEYSVENLVLHDGVLYECVETTTGPFDETKWSRKYLSDVGELNSNLVKLLWTNPNPSSAFSAQTVSLDFTNYTHAIVEMAQSDTSDWKTRVIVGKNEVNNFGGGYVNYSDPRTMGRNISLTDSGVIFKSGTSSGSVNDGFCIPQKIYGINITLP